MRLTLTAALIVSFLSATAMAQPAGDHLKCFKVKDPQAKTTYVADLDGLAAEAGCTVKVPAALACVPSSKTNVSPVPPGDPGAVAQSFGCYKVKCPKGATLPALALNDEFGSRTGTPVKPKLLCAPMAAPAPDRSCLQPFEPTLQLALDVFGLDEAGNIEFPPSCGGSSPFCCPGGTPTSPCGPLHVQITSASISGVIGASRFDVRYDMKLATVSDLPVSVPLVGDCLLHIDTALGTQPTIGLNLQLNLSPDNLRINSIGNTTLSGLETADMSLGGSFGCQFANDSVSSLDFLTDLLTDQIETLLRLQAGVCRFCDSTLGECTYFGTCTNAEDCDSGVCQPLGFESRCAAFAHCGNGIQDEGELHVDCGGMSSGSGCFGCAAGESCVDNFDCISFVCLDGTCQ